MKELNRRDFIRGALGLGAVSALTAVTGISAFAEDGKNGAIYTPGTYTASARGREGDVIVTVTFDETHILDVTVDASAETPAIGGVAADTLAEQVKKAQSSAIDGVSGATDTSVAVKNAVADCIFQASGGAIVEGGAVAVQDAPAVDAENNLDWLGIAPEIAEAEIVETLDTEVLVVGAGNSGLMTAARAASAGAKVIVIEKAISSMNERHWIGAVGTKEQEAAGTVIDKNKLVAELCKYASHRCDERLIRLWVNNSGEAIDWYAEQVKKYNPDVYLFHEYDLGEGDHDTYYCPATMHNFQDDIPEHDYSEATSAYGFASLTNVVNDNGGSIMYQTKLIKLEQNETGRVTGIIAQNETGDYIRINASKGVALCCGGYAYNKEMLATLNPDAYNSTVEADASANNTGDGIIAAMRIGADKDPDPTAMLFDRGTIAPDQLSDGNWAKSGYFHLGSQPWLKVNLNGERFCNEFQTGYEIATEITHKTEDALSWAIVDQANADLNNVGSDFDFENGYLFRADSLEELAAMIDIPADKLVETATAYNAAANGEAEDSFGGTADTMDSIDDGPYYALKMRPCMITSLIGVTVDGNCHVLREDGTQIPNLFAAGDMILGNMFHIYNSGHGVGNALYSGNMSAQTAKAEM